MTEKTNKIKLPKYSSYLTDTDLVLLDSFCTQFDCSKAKALPLLLKFWNDNKNNVSNELANEDRSAKKYDERLATIEDKLANISYDTELATIKERLATLENMLATIANDDLAIISNELANEDNLTGAQRDEGIDYSKNDITVESTISKSSNLPLSEVSPQIIPETTYKPVNDDIVVTDDEMVNSESAVTENEDTVNCDNGNKIGSLTSAIDLVILPKLAKGTPKAKIAELLQGKYRASVNGTSVNWQGSVVERALKSRNDGKA